MAKKAYEESKIANIAVAIREKTGGNKTYKTSEMPSGINEVYDKGCVDGYNEGYTNGDSEGYDKGREYSSILTYRFKTLKDLWDGATFPENTELVLRLDKVISCVGTFKGVSNLKKIKLICNDNPNVVGFNEFIHGCSHLEVLDLSECHYRFGNAIYFAYGCSKLKSIFGALDFSECANAVNAFTAKNSLLEDIEFVPNTIKVSISFLNQQFLTGKSIESIIDGLADLTGQTAQTLTLHADVGAKLTDEQKVTITAKNWILAY